MVASRYDKALERNLAELQKILLIRATLLGIEKHAYTTKVFIRVIDDALHNDHMSHAIKVFEQSSKAASFWYLYRSDPKPINRYAAQTGYPIAKLQVVTGKLKAIRNGTHFHIDSTGVLDANAVWTGADITGKDLAAAIDFAWGALCAVQLARGGVVPDLLGYTPNIALAALQRVESGKP